MTHLEEFTNLTKAEVEALLECFDFLRNGYQQLIDFNQDGLWIIRMKHKKNGCRLTVMIRGCEYMILRNGRLSKNVAYPSTADRYKLFVNSDMSIGVVRLSPDANKTLVTN